MTYDAVIFDLFGTLIDNFTVTAHQRVLTEMAAILGAPGPEFVRLWSQTYQERTTGVFPSTTANVEYVCRALGLSPNADSIAVAAQTRAQFTRHALVQRPDVIPTLAELKARGHKLGLITDCSPEVPLVWDDTPFAPLFGVTIFSCVAGIRKPDQRIYAAACAALATDPHRCLYVGDGGSHELSGAAQAGLDPVLIRLPDGAEHAAYRVDAEEWVGRAISSLSEVLALV